MRLRRYVAGAALLAFAIGYYLYRRGHAAPRKAAARGRGPRRHLKPRTA